MSIKTILVPVTGSESDAAALTSACIVARDQAAHVEALFVRPDPRDAVPMLGEGLSGALVDEIVEAAQRRSDEEAVASRHRFDEVAAAFEAPVVERPGGTPAFSLAWREVTGRIEDIVVRSGRLTDLLVFAHAAMDATSLAHITLQTTLMSAGRPLLLAPVKPWSTVGGTVALAWNGQAESARAVFGAMPFIRKAQTVHILTAETGRTRYAAADQLADYLAWHGVQTVSHRIAADSGQVGAALLQGAAAVGSDLFVMGGYGHSRVRELILGGVTRYVLANATLPVLMAH